MEITSDPIDLWVEPGSKLNEIRKNKISTFDHDFRIETMFFKLRDTSKPSIDLIDAEKFKEVWYLEKLLKEAPYED